MTRARTPAGGLVARIAGPETSNGMSYRLVLVPFDSERLTAALRKAGHVVNGYALEAVLVRLSELGDPVWASEISFDAESEACVVRCSRRAPLVHLARRLERRLSDDVRLRKLIRGIQHRDDGSLKS
jgi:hypothetical protein